jgi:hypothetical protein
VSFSQWIRRIIKENPIRKFKMFYQLIALNGVRTFFAEALPVSVSSTFFVLIIFPNLITC